MTLHHPLPGTHPGHAFGLIVVRAAEHVLEGRYRWGSVEVTPTGRTSWCRTRLMVYPPGITHAERRALQFHRLWPIIGALVAIVSLSALRDVPATWAFAFAAGIYAAGIVGGFSLTRTLRPRLRTITVMAVPRGGEIEVLGDTALFDLATGELQALDRLDRLGLITPAEYERSWAAVYDAMPGERPGAQRLV